MPRTRSALEILPVGFASFCSRVRGSLGGAALFSAVWAPGALAAVESPLPVPPDHAARMSRGLESFDREISSLLTEHCLKCHGGEKTKGDFDVSHRDSLLKGGVDGPSVAAFHSEKSRLIRMLKHEEEPYMPEKKPRLSDEVIAKIVAWIDQGAPYSKPLVEGKKPERDRSKVGEEDRRWWSFLPLSHPVVPAVAVQSHPVDRFLAAKGAAKGLSLAPRADKRTLIRRATLDLTGLPPTPAEVEKFVADTSPEAWPRLIDELLSRPVYGERWARHWMDVARYGESSGFEQDYDRAGSYQYRDFLIQAFNSDMPFSQFVQWQLAGDEFSPGNPRALAATAFLSLGVFPTQVTVNELERVRYEDLDDMLSTTGSAFLGLTVGCARCHDHKYDPIPTKDYYRMLSTFTGTVRSELELDVDPEKTVEQKAAWRKAHEAIVEEQRKLEVSLKPVFQKFVAEELPKLPEPVGWAVWASVAAKASAGSTLESRPDGSFLAKGATVPDRENYEFEGAAPGLVMKGLRVEALVDKSLAGGGPGRAGKGNFQLSKVRVQVVGPDGAVKEVPFSKAEADFEQKPAGGVAGLVSGQKGAGWSVGGKEKADHALALTFAEAWMPEAGSRLRVTLEFQGQAKHSMGRPRLAWMVGEEPALQRPTLPEGVAELILARKAPESEADLAKLERWWRAQNRSWMAVEARRVASEKAEPTGLSKVLVASESFPPIRYHTAGGSVETYKKTFVLKRGNVALKEEEASPGFLQVLSRAPEERWVWTPPQNATYAGRRRALANWILDEKEGAGALAARVFVNRLWLHHFGQGIVSTPNDFGKTGAAPSQPELLDWLAERLVESGGSVKAMHRLLMTSEAYQQAAVKDALKEKADPGNDLFLRRVPKRLEGEAIRDCMLSVSGLLDGQMYGPGVADERSPRRSVYLRVKRSKLISSMVSFDQPEPLASQGVRPTTTVAPQALFLMNSLQARDCTQALAGRVLKSAGKDAPVERLIGEAYGLTLSRAPLPEESSEAREFLETQTARWVAHGEPRPNAFNHALADFCQVLFQTNEFVYRP